MPRQFLSSSAFPIMAIAIGLTIMSLWIIGTPATRDVIDYGSIIGGGIVGSIYLMPALRRLREGAYLPEWRMIIGLMMLGYGWAALRMWAMVFRWLERPEWMSEHWINAILVEITFGGFLLIISASAEPLPRLPATRIYYVAAGVVAGILIGLSVPQVWAWFG